MKISKTLVRQLKKKAMKIAAVMAIKGKSSNQIASEMKISRDPFLSSVAWKELRKKAIQEYGAKCMKCGYTPKDLRKINIDHIKPRKFSPQLALDFNNLQVLCARCNKEKGNKHQTDYRG